MELKKKFFYLSNYILLFLTIKRNTKKISVCSRTRKSTIGIFLKYFVLDHIDKKNNVDHSIETVKKEEKGTGKW